MDKPKNYEESITRLRELVSSLEAGSLSLEESMAYYKEAVELAKFCEKQLDEAEQQITELTEELQLPSNL